MIKKIYIYFVSVILSTLAFAGGYDLKFEKIGEKEGITQKTIFSIFQDRKGLMWFGTEDGLVKYNGYSSVIYKNISNNKDSLLSNNVKAICEDRSGNIWIGTDEGLNKLDTATGKIERFVFSKNDSKSISGNDIRAIYMDKGGKIYIGTYGDGLNIYVEKTNNFKRLKNKESDSESISDDRITTIFEDSINKLWIGTESGLNKLERNTNKFTRFIDKTDVLNERKSNIIKAICEDRNGDVWIATDYGMKKFDKKAEKFLENYKNSVENQFSISSDSIRSIMEDVSGTLWIGTKNGLNAFNRVTGKFTSYTNDPAINTSISNNNILCMYQDYSGVMWIGTNAGGLNKTGEWEIKLYKNDPSIYSSLSENNVWSITEDKDGTVWIGTDGGGLNSLNKSTGDFTVYKNGENDKTSIPNDSIKALCIDVEGILWVGTKTGLAKWDKKNKKFVTVLGESSKGNALINNNIKVITDSGNGLIWIGTKGGLASFDKKSGMLKNYKNIPDKTDSLINDNVRAIAVDKENNVWVGTDGGLSKFDPLTETFKHYINDPKNANSLTNNIVTVIHVSGKNKFWIGTYGGGIDEFDIKTEKFTAYTKNDGLVDNAICGILEDKSGRLWISTNQGLARFDPVSKTFKSYNDFKGLQGLEYNAGAFYKNEDGAMYFGGINGMNQFFPDKEKDTEYMTPVILTDFKKLNKSVMFNKNIADIKEIPLSYKDNFFSFEFAALDYTAPDKNKYAYKLEGFDKDWIFAGERRYASYTNLERGRYIFRVKASNSVGIWNDNGLAINIKITPPPWKTWQAYLLYVLLVIIAVMAFVKYTHNEAQRKRLMLTDNMRHLTDILTETLDLREVMHILLDNLSHIVQFDKAFVMLKNGESVLKGLDNNQNEETELELNRKLMDKVILEGKALFFKDVQKESEYKEMFSDKQLHSVIIIPIKHKDDFVGILVAASKLINIYDKECLDITKLFTSQVGIAIENARHFEEVKKFATTDNLTNLYNRRYLLEVGEHELQNAKNARMPFSVIIADIDHFKKLDDYFGLKIGDNILRMVARTIYTTVKNEAIIGRYGEEEFAIILKGYDTEKTKELCSKIAEDVKAMPMIFAAMEDIGSLVITLSYGISSMTAENLTINTIFDKAYKALSNAKKKGRNKVEVEI